MAAFLLLMFVLYGLLPWLVGAASGGSLMGLVNPMLAEHGSLSAARQYSGRAVGEDWRCPFSGRSSERKT